MEAQPPKVDITVHLGK